MTGGLLLATLGFLAAARLVGHGVEAIIAASTLYSLGLSPVFTLGIDTIIAAAPPERAGAASAISETGSELGGALGVALLGSLATAIYRGSLGRAELGGVPAGIRAVALETLGGAVGAAGHLPPRGPGALLLDAARLAFTHALATTLVVCGGVTLATAVVVVSVLRGTADGNATTAPSGTVGHEEGARAR